MTRSDQSRASEKIWWIITKNKHVFPECSHRRPKLTIRGIDQIFMIYLRVSSETWLLYVCGVVVHIGPLSARSTRHCMEFKMDAQSKLKIFFCCILTEKFWLCIRLVSRICHEGAVANVDFKLCRRLLDDHTTSCKVETSSSEAKIVRIGAGSFKIFQSRSFVLYIRGPLVFQFFYCHVSTLVK